MKTILEILIEDYHLCITRFPMNSRAYRMLMNGVLVRNDKGHEVTHILCDSEMIATLRQAVATFCPELVERMREIPEY